MRLSQTGSFSSDQLVNFMIQTHLALLNNDSGREEDDRPFFVVDLGVVTRQYQRWVRNLPAFRPFYGIVSLPCQKICQKKKKRLTSSNSRQMQ